jgi:uncharacterized protein YjbI with pentapeptide repeats
MKKTAEDLQIILDLHKKWLLNEKGGERAYLSGAYLSGAYLNGANLSGADLSGADLNGADLRDADLSGAYIRNADLSGAYLSGADLSGADLSGADLNGADLRDADLSGSIKVPMYCKWSHGITDGLIHIGCEKRSIEEWDIFFESEEIIETPRNNDDFIQIQAVYNAYKAYLLTFKKEL